jgi:hypothetical protein
MAHVHEKDGNYLIEQLCTIGACGALGAVAIMMWMNPDGLNFLGLQFQKPFGHPALSPVLWGGVAVVALVLIRATVVWISVGKSGGHAHDHPHAQCDHFHEPHIAREGSGLKANAPAPNHGHEHGWAPWRYAMLLVPVGLYFLNLIPPSLQSHAAVNTAVNGPTGTVTAKGGEVIHAFLELDRASATPDLRREYEGRRAQVSGEVTVNADSRHFGLVRYKINCCVADAVPLNLVVEVPADSVAGKNFNAQSLGGGQWVDVTGIIQFRTVRGTDRYVTVLVVEAKDLRVIDKPSNPYVY